MLVDILVFRFFLKSSALETLGWLGFFFLQVCYLPPTPCSPSAYSVRVLRAGALELKLRPGNCRRRQCCTGTTEGCALRASRSTRSCS